MASNKHTVTYNNKKHLYRTKFMKNMHVLKTYRLVTSIRMQSIFNEIHPACYNIVSFRGLHYAQLLLTTWSKDRQISDHINLFVLLLSSDYLDSCEMKTIHLQGNQQMAKYFLLRSAFNITNGNNGNFNLYEYETLSIFKSIPSL